MSIRAWATSGVVVLAAAVAGVATSQQPAPSPVAATQVSLPRSRVDNAALAQARQDPLIARARSVLAQNKAVTFMPRVDASTVPVLAPADVGLLGTAEFTSGDRFYMLVVQRGEQIIEIYGAAKAFQSPLGAPAPVGAAAPSPVTRAAPATAATQARAAAVARGPRISAARVPDAAARALAVARARGLTNVRTERTEYGVDVTFNRFGAAYNVSFLCEGAPDCAEADAIMFAAGLQLIGGGAS